MLDVRVALKSSSVCRSLTGLNPKEFLDLVPDFEKTLDEFANSKPRQRKVGGGNTHTLKTTADKLFFILYYLKTYPTYAVAGFLYGTHRSQPEKWVRKYLPLLEQTLGKKCCLPEREITSADEFMKKFPGIKNIFIDGTEREVQRPKKKEKRKVSYSGKKKRHTSKHVAATDEKKRS